MPDLASGLFVGFFIVVTVCLFIVRRLISSHRLRPRGHALSVEQDYRDQRFTKTL